MGTVVGYCIATLSGTQSGLGPAGIGWPGCLIGGDFALVGLVVAAAAARERHGDVGTWGWLLGHG